MSFYPDAIPENDASIKQLPTTPKDPPPNTYQCTNCEQLFTKDLFEEHICEYDENQKYIEDEMSSSDEDARLVPNSVTPHTPGGTNQSADSMRDHFPNHGILMKLLETNNATIFKWLKADYKLDLSKLSTASSAVDHQPIVAKKHEGPHSCTMCDRKFVHASGLARHMEKHEHEKSVGSPWSVAMTHDPGAAASLETGIKCARCLRVFRRADDCVEHMRHGHEMGLVFADTIDFSDDEKEPEPNQAESDDGGDDAGEEVTFII